MSDSRSLHRFSYGLLVLTLCAAPARATSQQVGDSSYVPTVDAPAFASGEGPRVALDEGHVNFHTLSGRFRTFADLLRADGYVVVASGDAFSESSLAGVDLLVIANALNPRNEEDWSLPTPSAFSPSEIDSVRRWVEEGGSVLLIADHMPFPGAASDLASAFGFRLNNGFAFDPATEGPLVFRRADGSLRAHTVTDGSREGDRVDSVASFTGEAFQSPDGATDLLVMPAGVVSYMPDVAWELDSETRSVDVAGWSQGSVSEFGRGRVAVFGEAAMFSAQVSGPEARPMGMNAPVASQNARFVTNLVRWLTRVY